MPGRKYVKGHRPLKLSAQGYRRIWVGKEHPLADTTGMCLEHRVIAWNAGVLTDRSLHVHHKNGIKTDNRIENLEVVTSGEHSRLHWDENRSTHCPKGHEYTPENTALNPSGWRYCKQCNRDRARSLRPELRAT